MGYNLQEKFNVKREPNQYRRINENHNIDIFIGYNENVQLTMSVKGRSNVRDIESSKYIATRLSKNQSNHTYVIFSLLDESMSSIFLKFCEDLIVSSEKIPKENAIEFVISRWNSWRNIFKKNRVDLLSEKEIMGLIGELIFIKKFLIPKLGENVAIESWKGSTGASKDFEMFDTWYEIKTKMESSLAITISSIEQLDSEEVGYLVIISLEKSNKISQKALSLNKLVYHLEESIIKFENKLKFKDKLIEIGYYHDEEYDNFNFNIKEFKFYKVDNNFPKIKKNALDDGIVKVSYKILIDSIEKYLEEEVL